jgi:hypothetical protein
VEERVPSARADTAGRVIELLGVLVVSIGTGCNSAGQRVSTPDAWLEALAQVASRDVSLGQDTTGDVSQSWAEACSSYAQAYCQAFLTCQTLAFHQALGDMPTCEARYGGANCEVEMQSAGSTVTPSNLLACAQELSVGSCAGIYQDVPQACDWRGSLSELAPCTYDQQCQSGRCDLVANSWCGSCQVREPSGGACSVTRSCESGLVCADSSCSVAVEDGGICNGVTRWVCTSPGGPGGGCITTAQCAWGLACIDGQCAPWKDVGDPCQNLECNREKDEFCLLGQEGGGDVCVPISYAALGETCSFEQGTWCSNSAPCIGGDGTPSEFGVCTSPSEDEGSCDSTANCRYPSQCISGVCKTAADMVASCE